MDHLSSCPTRKINSHRWGSLGLTSIAFDLVIADEAARCTAGELAVPIQAGQWIVLEGDHAQLEPLHRNELVEQVATEVQIATGEVVRSDFGCVFTSPYGSQGATRLTKQYRIQSSSRSVTNPGRLTPSSLA